LLSPIIYKHAHMLIFDAYLMVFLAPGTIIVVEETSTGFVVKNRYKIEELDRFDKFKMYALGQKGLLVVYNKPMVFLLDKIGYTNYELPEASSIVHLTELNGQEFFAAEFAKGLTHYRLNFDTAKI
jgi:hypothetical protein